MILFNQILETEEEKIASENLPNHFYIEMDNNYKDELHSTSHLWLFPYSDSCNCKEEDFFTYFSSSPFAKLKQDSRLFHSEETVSITLDKIPSVYEFVDIYLIGYKDYKLNSKITFSIKKNSKINYLFGYQQNFINYHTFSKNNGSVENIHIGTFGKVSNGWKFYPVFEEKHMKRREIIDKYIV